MGSLDDSIAVHNLNKKIVMGDDGYVLEDVPHLSDYIPSLPTYPNPLKEQSFILTQSLISILSMKMIQLLKILLSARIVQEGYIFVELVLAKTIVMGIDGGYRGFYSKNTIPLTPKVVNYNEEVYIFGGDGIQKGASVLFEEITRRGLNVVVVGIPKTIDNDIPIIDKSFGFDSAVEEAQRAAHVEAMSFENGIGVVKLMGRDSGFIAMIGGVFEYIEQRLKENGHVVIVVAEGAGQDDEQVDVGLWISKRIKEHFSKEKKMINLKYRSDIHDSGYCK
ncbi:hypothetical protein KY290_022189 [Solanum tuberosum]|uniref:Phosphofructokinase domain-containing protein n=1 Tax=Solanum tuberosum TaxID=4113 RepID=A0ABQ7V3N6_SOLTU|nr:hypothetical protein KY289_021318 [Solanum tuberosum]KAH0758696.1 hypothetical protein KY290_022189 [Solanum tuberosum]